MDKEYKQDNVDYTFFENGENKVFIGNVDKISEWKKLDDGTSDKIIERIKLLIKNYLELDNVSFLFGSGSSIHLGAVSIRNFPKEVEEYIKSIEERIYEQFLDEIRKLQKNMNLHELNKKYIRYQDVSDNDECDDKDEKYEEQDGIIRIKETHEILIEFERVLNYLMAKYFILSEEEHRDANTIKKLITVVKEGLFRVCNVEVLPIPKEKIKAEYLEIVESNKYYFHEKFLKSLLQRPLNLKRANIFTLNYDLAFEYAFENLGIFYINGFAGFHKRYFRPETFEYDMFYPGSTTSGKVQRIEKVIRYFKLHGSISWIKTKEKHANNLYGIEEVPLPLIEKMKNEGEIIIYPSAVKKSYTLDFPYSELLRQFAVTITQPQSVLFTIGYSFADEHINDIIFQALSNPSFTLIIFAYSTNDYIEKIKALNDPRIIILEGNYLGDFVVIADKLMPDFYDIESKEKIANTLKKYFSQNTNKEEQIDY